MIMEKYVNLYSDAEKEELKREFTNVALAQVGATVLEVSDERRGAGANLLRVLEPTVYNPEARVDGWLPGGGLNLEVEKDLAQDLDQEADFIIIRFLRPTVIQGFSLNTIGIPPNEIPRRISVDAKLDQEGEWARLATNLRVKPDTENFFRSQGNPTLHYGFMRLRVFRQRGLSRLRVYGTLQTLTELEVLEREIDVCNATNGARVVYSSASETDIGDPWHIIMQGYGNLDGGWVPTRTHDDRKETFVVISLSTPCALSYMDLVTTVPEGERPACFQFFAYTNQEWVQLACAKITAPNQRCELFGERNLYTKVMLVVYPVGGVMRLRVMGLVGLTDGGNQDAIFARQAGPRLERMQVLARRGEFGMNPEGNMQHNGINVNGVNAFAFFSVAKILDAGHVDYQVRALLRLITVVNKRGEINVNQIANALIRIRPNLTTAEGQDFLTSVTLGHTTDLPMTGIHHVSDLGPEQFPFLGRAVRILNEEFGSVSRSIAYLLYFIRALNPNNDRAPLVLPELCTALIQNMTADVNHNINQFNAFVESDEFRQLPIRNEMVTIFHSTLPVDLWSPKHVEYFYRNFSGN